MAIIVENRIGPQLAAVVVEVDAIRQGEASPELRERCAELAAQVIAAGRNADGGSAWISDSERRAVRQLLKGGGFSPTGRNRPAHELLCNLILHRGEFPHISHAVDVNNLLSIQYRVPISLLDASKVGPKLILRWGQPGESYVFNQSGHMLVLKHCLVACGTAAVSANTGVVSDADPEVDGIPLGSPIKDSMAGKVFAGCTHVLAVAYVPTASQWSEEQLAEFQTGVHLALGFGQAT